MLTSDSRYSAPDACVSPTTARLVIGLIRSSLAACQPDCILFGAVWTFSQSLYIYPDCFTGPVIVTFLCIVDLHVCVMYAML